MPCSFLKEALERVAPKEHANQDSLDDINKRVGSKFKSTCSKRKRTRLLQRTLTIRSSHFPPKHCTICEKPHLAIRIVIVQKKPEEGTRASTPSPLTGFPGFPLVSPASQSVNDLGPSLPLSALRGLRPRSPRPPSSSSNYSPHSPRPLEGHSGFCCKFAVLYAHPRCVLLLWPGHGT